MKKKQKKQIVEVDINCSIWFCLVALVLGLLCGAVSTWPIAFYSGHSDGIKFCEGLWTGCGGKWARDVEK